MFIGVDFKKMCGFDNFLFNQVIENVYLFI